MTRLPILTARTLEKILYNLGFERVRQKGSHVFYRHPDGKATTIPIILGEISLAHFYGKYSGRST